MNYNERMSGNEAIAFAMKQIDPVDEQGHIIMDFSIYDAIHSGFADVVFVVSEQLSHQRLSQESDLHAD